MSKFDWREFLIVPLVLAVGIMIAQTLIASNDEGIKQAGIYMRYLIIAVGTIWLGSLPLRLRRANQVGYSF